MALPTLPKLTLSKLNQYFRERNSIRWFSATLCLRKQMPSNFKGKKGSHQWITRQINDPYVKKAKQEHFRCRSAYKLIEIDERYNILKPGNIVVDCGAAPGSWSQVAVERTWKSAGSLGKDSSGKVISVDLQHIHPIEGATIFAESDFTKSETQSKILDALDGRLVDVVLSDMAPSATGNRQLDHDVICELCLTVLKFSTQVLQTGGHVVCKLWDGHDRAKIETVMNRMFKNVRIVKPESSRTDSAELFLLGMDYLFKKK